ncbi:MAG TPA: patatin-like phospholipase family protein [Gemmatimonadaceae bacterium]|nr:patatin-like phospholipase family protein [Gemmatimonadaceae bacterium]
MRSTRPRRAPTAVLFAVLALAPLVPPRTAAAQIDTIPAEVMRAGLRAAREDSARAAAATAREPYPIVLTVEGGGSLGVYEAGMTWALVEMFKRKRAVEERDPRWGRQAAGSAEALAGLPWLRLAAVTGASSGSVNAFLAAASWCDRALDTRPEDSPFWRAWVATGLAQLLPRRHAAGDGEGGILSRRHVSENAFGWTKRYWRARSWDPGCAVEFGATVTRLHAEPVPINRAIQAGNMRWASTFTVTGGDRGPRLLPRLGDQDGYRFGRIAVLPPVGDTIPVDAAIGLLEASSAFPLAFEPKRLTFCGDAASSASDARSAAEARAALRAACGGRGRTTAQFVDGGVFDNAPLALGFGLLLRDSSLTVARFPYALYLSPEYRRRWPDGRADGHGGREPGAEGKRPPPPARGLQTLVTLAAEAVPTARQYELQFASRLLPREVERLAQLELQRVLELRELQSRTRAERAEGRADAADRRGAALDRRARCLDSLLLRSHLRADSLRRLADSLSAELLAERRRADSAAAAAAAAAADTTLPDSVRADSAGADTAWSAGDTLAAPDTALSPPDDSAVVEEEPVDAACPAAAPDAAGDEARASAADASAQDAGVAVADAGPLDDYIRATGRWHPIAGEWLGGFGAFLGRPLREYDFYVGVYDALALVAHDVQCAHLGLAPPPRALQGCVRDSLRALVERPPVPLGDVAPRVLRALYASEFAATLGAPRGPRPSAAADSSWAVLAAVQRAMAARMEPGHAAAPHRCAASGVAAGLVCRNGLVEFFRALRAEPRAARVMRARAAARACAPDAPPARGADCLVERRFVETVGDPEGTLGALLRDLIGRMRETTPRGGRVGLAPRGADALALLYYSTDERTRRGFDLGQSSLPAGGAAAPWWLLPNAVALGTRRPGLELEWELRRHLGSAPLALALPLRLNTSHAGAARPAAPDADGASRLTPGVRLDLKSSIVMPWVTRFSVQGDYWARGGGSGASGAWYRSVSGGVSMSVLAGKLSVSAMSVPPAYRDVRDRLERRYGAPVVLGAELGDVNGMLYWITSMIRG